MYNFNDEVFRKWLSDMDDRKVVLHYSVLCRFYDVLNELDPNCNTIFIDLLDEIEVNVLNECAFRFAAFVYSRDKGVIRAFECLGKSEEKTD